MPRKGENIRQRSDKRWEARYIVRRDENGKAVYRSVYGGSYSEVKEKRLREQAMGILGQAVGAVTRGSNGAAGINDLTFDAVCNEWLDAKRISGVKLSTYNRYYSICHRYLMPGFLDVRCTDITYEIAEKYISDIVMLSDSTLNSVITIFNSVMELAAQRYGATPVKIKYRKCERRDIVVPPLDEMQKLIKTMISDDVRKQNISKLGIVICLFTGIRIGELCALRWDDIDLENEYIVVEKTIQRIQNIAGNESAPAVPSSGMGRRSTGATYLSVTSAKTESSRRVVPLPPLLVTILKGVCHDMHAGAYFLSGNACPVEPRTMQYRFKHYLRDAGVREYNFHILRHAFATRCVELGSDITTLSKVLGHSSVTVTLSKYVHPTLEMKRVMINNLSFSGSEKSGSYDLKTQKDVVFNDCVWDFSK